VVWIYTLLHHFVDNLEGVLPKLVACTRPGGRIIITEPVSLSPLLRSFRLKYFAAPVGTPHERPLEPKDIDVIERHVPGFKIRYYRATSRLDRVILPDRQLESAAWWRVGLFRSLCALDYAALSIPFCHRAASMAVMWGESE